MIKLKTKNDTQLQVVINPNDTLDLIVSIEKILNGMLELNQDKIVKKVKITLGSSKATSEQQTKEYPGIDARAYIIKKGLAGGDNGYFSDVKDRKVYNVFKDSVPISIKNFDNHIKFVFRCKTATERETLRSLLTILFTFHTKELDAKSVDLDYFEDIEKIENEMFTLNLFIHARTTLKWTYEYNVEKLKGVVFVADDFIPVAGITEKEIEVESGFF